MKIDEAKEILKISIGWSGYEDRIQPQYEKVRSAILAVLGYLEKDGFILVQDEEPPLNIDLLAKSPLGETHLCVWRPTYGIFSCQNKYETTLGWSWKLV